MLSRYKVILFLIAIAIAVHGCKSDKAIQIPISDFFKTPEKSNFKISPDGKYLSYVKPDREKQQLFIKSLADGNERKAITFGNYAGRDYSWTFDNKIVYTQYDPNPNKDESKLITLDVATLKQSEMLSEKKVRIRILNRNKLQPDEITIEMNKRDSTFFDIYRLNVKTGELKTYLLNTGKITDWYPDSEGKILLAKVSDGVDETILYRPNESTPFREIIKNNFTQSVIPIAFTKIRNDFYALSNVNRDKTALVTINAETGKEDQVVFASDKADILNYQYSRNRHRIDFVSWQEAKPHKYFLNGDAERVYKSLLKHQELAGNEINVMSSDSAEIKFIISTYTDRNPGAVYLYDSQADKLDLLANNSTLNPDELCTMRPIKYRSSDQKFIINGYLTLPLGDSTNLPLVVMPHDGPFGYYSRDSWGYNPDVQFLANRGYAVLQVNYRGSSGYGKAFYSGGFKEVGGKIQQDITDGVDSLIANKVADPKKIAIFGRGFGGFSALYGVSFHPKLYTCAIVQNPLINFFTFVKNVPPFLKPSLRKVYETVGDPEKDADQFQAISPVSHPDRIKVPLLIFPARDQRANANLNELNLFVRELKSRGVYVDYQLHNNERGPSRMRDRVERYAQIQKFLDSQMLVKR